LGNLESSAVVNGNVEDNTGTEITLISEEESMTNITYNSAAHTDNEGTITSESETVNYGGLFSAAELDQLQNLNISESIGGGRKN